MKSSKGFWTIVVLIGAGVIGYHLYFGLYSSRKIQLRAYAFRELRINDRVTPRDFYIRPVIIDSDDYEYVSPVGMFLKENVNINTPLDLTNLQIQKVSRVVSAPVRIPVKLNLVVSQVLKPGDDIALSINGKIFPERAPASTSFRVLDIIPITGKDYVTVTLVVDPEHLTDSLWLQKDTDHIVPIIIRSAPMLVCPKGERLKWVKDPMGLSGRYTCEKIKKRRFPLCPCDTLTTKHQP